MASSADDRAEVVAALRRSGYNIVHAARDLGTSRRTLQNRMIEFGLARGTPGRRKRRLPYRRFKLGSILGGVAALGLGVLAVSKLGGKKV